MTAEPSAGPRVSVDRELCIGSGDCARLVPAAFVVDDALGVAVPLPGAAGVDPARLVEAGLNCPTNAIRVIGEDGAVLLESNG